MRHKACGFFYALTRVRLRNTKDEIRDQKYEIRERRKASGGRHQAFFMRFAREINVGALRLRFFMFPSGRGFMRARCAERRKLFTKRGQRNHIYAIGSGVAHSGTGDNV